MKLHEHEAKQLLEKHGLEIPSCGKKENDGFVVKAQILANSRKDMGAVKFADTIEEAEKIREEMLETEFEGVNPEKVLIEERLDIEKEYYISFMYDTDTRSPAMIFSEEGGSGIEDRGLEKLPLKDEDADFEGFLRENDLSGGRAEDLASVLEKMFTVFLEEDARLIEVNPLAETEKGFVVVDAMIDLEDDASFRHEWNYPDRSVMARDKTGREKRAEKIDEDDHRGVAGKYTELDGDIGMMLAGGGASLTNMDAMIEAGGKPANYTEYGGNPPEEKVYRLSKVIMDKPGLKGLWHVGGTANNTDIYRTMKGFCRALEEEKPDYPIVVRRDGPNADKAFELLRETRDKLGLNMKLFRNDTSMTETAETLMEMIEGDGR